MELYLQMTKQDHEDTFPIHINNQQDYIVHVMRDQHTLVKTVLLLVWVVLVV
ncbi:035L [Invertebrate iridescent virus Kaz2018]|uniref:Uncharacterized protein n=1 Tax=Iridovirus sp. TaxID=135728 RepID=A0AAU7YEA7_9VIRU|nr:035L [Invertebrate iridescent virus Kaz2018]